MANAAFVGADEAEGPPEACTAAAPEKGGNVRMNPTKKLRHFVVVFSGVCIIPCWKNLHKQSSHNRCGTLAKQMGWWGAQTSHSQSKFLAKTTKAILDISSVAKPEEGTVQAAVVGRCLEGTLRPVEEEPTASAAAVVVAAATIAQSISSST